jgi:hypothetical protein
VTELKNGLTSAEGVMSQPALGWLTPVAMQTSLELSSNRNLPLTPLPSLAIVLAIGLIPP